MKRILLLVMVLLLLCGCAAPVADSGETIPTQPEIHLLKEQGQPWDQEGSLVEVPLSIPGGLMYANVLQFDGNLLLWNVDDHLQDQVYMELCYVSLTDGSVIASRKIPLGDYTVPQPLGDALFICDNFGGKVLQLDRNLQEVQQWAVEANGDRWVYCGDGRILQIVDSTYLHAYDFSTGQVTPVLEGDPQISYPVPQGDYLPLEYYDPYTGTPTYAVIDLTTGAIIQPKQAENYGATSVAGDAWLSSRRNAVYTYRFCNGTDEPVTFRVEGHYAEFVEGGLLISSEDSQYLHLYDLNGNPIASCRISETGNCMAGELIYNEQQGGYYVVLYTYDSNIRILFWDIGCGTDQQKLDFKPIPAPSAEEAALLQRCEEIGREYGVTVRIGTNCDTNFFDFTASHATDWLMVEEALDMLEDTLADYPAGMFRQLQKKAPQGLQIQLIRDLKALENTQYIAEYTAFVEDHWDCSLMAVDIETADQTTYYHEISHVIDGFVQWDSWEREEALFDESDWNALNPSWFDGYTYDYSMQRGLSKDGAFVDDYATISPTEDRARIMEYAMADYGQWMFEDAPILRQKLEYYAKCIRDAFDTTGWPLVTQWEQYLNLGVG